MRISEMALFLCPLHNDIDLHVDHDILRVSTVSLLPAYKLRTPVLLRKHAQHHALNGARWRQASAHTLEVPSFACQ